VLRPVFGHSHPAPARVAKEIPLAQATSSLSMPPEVGDWGPPERTIDLSAGKMSGQQRFAIASCVLSVPLCLIMATPLLICAVKPFGKGAPPPAVCWGVGGAFAALSLLSAYGVYYYSVLNRRFAGTFHLCRKGLVLARPGRDARRIAWEQIREEKPPGSMNPRHVFPVKGEAAIAFDYSCADHEALAAAITRKTTELRWIGLFGRKGLAALSTYRVPPVFLVHDPDDALLFRVSPIAGKLLFVCVGGGYAAGTRGFKGRRIHAQGGLAGGVAGWTEMKRVERVQQTLDALEGADERRLFEVSSGLRGSRLVLPDELTDVHISKIGWFRGLGSGVSLVGMLRFKHAEWGTKGMYFESLEQLGNAARILQDFLGGDSYLEEARLVVQG
jgi:hypothetical protein